jgi:hypothetical protein
MMLSMTGAAMKQTDDEDICQTNLDERQELWRAELLRISQGYWRHSPVGLPIPGFLAEHDLCIGAVPKLVRTRFLTDRTCLRYGIFALELEHRSQLIRTQVRLTAVIRRIVAADYDMQPAQRFSDAFAIAWDSHQSGGRIMLARMPENSRAGQGRMSDRRQHEDVPPELLRYPAGFQANMAIIRRLLAIT